MAEQEEDNQNQPTGNEQNENPSALDAGVTPAARDKGTGGDQVDNWGDLEPNPGGRQGQGSHPTDQGPPRPNDQHLHGAPRKGETLEEQKNQDQDQNPTR